MFKYF